MKTVDAILVVSIAIFGCLVMTTAAESMATTTDSIPDLTGVWKATMIGHVKTEGFNEKTLTFNITEQKGLAFTGVKEYTRDSGESFDEGFSGLITDDGTIYLGEYVGGISLGKLNGADEIELINVEDGDDAKVLLMTLTREKV